ncbi:MULTISPECIES: polysaccharide deacetylase family protein [Niastella]|uniref:Polysaccharide deacetylase family protein n=1 Tax=Niastella soli TaxID=2821487 RepID=A0ABS3YLR7_9BACT|nr:polysaccharide deacetylase family protein [Niastella soli]MBO9198816.1 polysaccharide deacetylase family protein [Niastella soli]
MIYIILAFLIVIAAIYIIKMGAAFGGLPVLNYHKISSGNNADFLTVNTAELRKHFNYLNKMGYTTIFISDVLAHIEQKKPLPAKPVMITLDDGYRDNYTSLYPLLKEYNIKANIFLVGGFIQSPDNKHQDPNPMGEFLFVHEALEMSKDMVEFGLHTYSHQSYSKLSLPEIDADLKKTKERLQKLGIPVQPCHAYTFGAYNQKDDNKRQAMFELLQQNDVRLAFRVSNWVDKLPIQNNYFVSRIHVSGLFSFFTFKVAVWGFIKIINRFEKIMK